MERIKQDLVRLFDEMLPQTRNFRKKTYEGIFMDCHRKYRDTIENVTNICAESKEEDKEALMREIASVIPEHALEKIGALTKRQKEAAAIDYNMDMVVYVLPLFTYTHNPYCDQVAEYMLERWNELKITDMPIGRATYEDIAGGFKKKLCYITTAVCESRDLSEDCYELSLLRDYRDNYLSKSGEGKRLVEDYYDVAPVLVRVIDMHKNRREIYDSIYQNYIRPCIGDIESGEREACREKYICMVHSLEEKYLS